MIEQISIEKIWTWVYYFIKILVIFSALFKFSEVTLSGELYCRYDDRPVKEKKNKKIEAEGRLLASRLNTEF